MERKKSCSRVSIILPGAGWRRRYEAEYAGIAPGVPNPAAVSAMKTAGIDISGSKVKAVFKYVREGAVCD